MARPRKEQELDIARRAIDETIRLLSERGDLDVPLTAVAHAIGCTAPALYGHFRNKSALLRAVREEGFKADFWDLRPVLLPIDTGAVQARRMLSRLIRQEAPAA